MNRLPLALTAKIRVSPESILKNRLLHDLAHQMMEEMLLARIQIGSTPAGLPSLPGFEIN